MPPLVTKILACLALSVVSVGIGVAVEGHLGGQSDCAAELVNQYLNPQLNCGQAYLIDKQAYIGLKHQLENFIANKQSLGEVDTVSVYFRDLYNGPTLGLNEHIEFVPASLLKLPLLLAYINFQIERPGLFDERLMLTGAAVDQSQYYLPSSQLETGVDYSVQDLLSAMMVRSDNQAFYVLRDYLIQIAPDRDLLLDTYIDLGLIDLGLIDPASPDDRSLSVKSYAAIFQQLYHASYLPTAEFSNQALEFLAQTEFDRGIEAGLPEGLEVAHKFGERSDLLDNEKQLHDCGVVYYPGNAYSLCIMTRGKDFAELETVIQAISSQVYVEFDSRRLR